MKVMKMMRTAILLLSIVFVVFSCDKSIGGEAAKGAIAFHFDGNPRELSKASMELPDTNDFLITVTDEAGVEYFDGYYGGLPETLEVPSGSYDVYVRSEDFSGIVFSSPQYGDVQCVVVPPQGLMSVALECRQINSGIRLTVSEEFLTEYPDGILFIKTGGKKLMYSYSEKRIAYFAPGSVSVILDNDGQETVLLTRTVVAQEILSLKVNVSASTSSSQSLKGISISLDTARVWTNETYLLGDEDSKGSTFDSALTVSQALASVGREAVWVSGFIVGGDLTSANASFDPPFKSATNLLLGPRSTASYRDNCIAVQLPSGSLRDELNLVSHPEMLGRLVCIRGDIEEPYFGMVGLRNVSDYFLK